MKESGISWIGLIPDNWGIEKTKYRFNNKKEIVGDREPYFERLALTLDGVIKRSKVDSKGLQPERFDTYQIVYSNELLFKLIDLQNINTSRVGLSPWEGIVSSAYIKLSSRDKDFTKFAYFYYLSLWHNNVWNFLGGDGVRSSLNPIDLLNVPLPIPPLDEQQKIVSIIYTKLTNIDQLIKNQELQIEKLKEYKQSLISEIIKKGLNPRVKLKKSGIEWIGDIPEHWVIKPLKYSAKVNLNSLKESTDPNYLLKYVEIGNVTQEDGILNTEEFYFKDSPSRARRKVEVGDVIVSTVRTYLKAVARISEHEKDYIVSTGFAVIHPNDNVSQRYLAFYLCSNVFTDLVSSFSYGVQYPAINSTLLMAIKTIIPPYDEQTKIADYLERKIELIDSSIKIISNKTTKLHELKRSLIYEYVTGKKVV